MSSPSTNKIAASARTQALLSGPIASTMLRLAAPTIVVMVIQVLVGVLQTFFVSRLGTIALAAVSLVFPVLMLMQMMSNGGFGAGVTSAVARAVGAGRKADADALVLHAVVLGLGLGLVFTIAESFCGEALYRALGASGETLSVALSYSRVIFAGAILVWVVNLLAAALRGSGNANVPALVSITSLIVIVPLSPVFIFGWGPVPALGVAGAGVALIAFYVLAAVALVAYLRSGRSNLALRFGLQQLRWRLFKEVFHVGSLSAVGAAQANLTVAVVTGAVGLFGAEAIAGYGIASRLDYALLPLLFGLGTAVITMVGVNVGAGHIERASRVAWTGAWIAAGVSELIGLAVTIAPQAWLGIFSADQAVLESGSRYLRIVGPSYGVYGLGMLLNFAGQGAGRVFWHVIAGTARFLIAAVVGWLVVAEFGGGLTALFLTITIGTLAFGAVNVAAKWRGAWGQASETAGKLPGGTMPAPALGILPDDRS